MAFGVTAIKKIVNRTNQSVEVRKRDNINDIAIVKPLWEVYEDIWIPWVFHEQDFEEKVIQITYLRDNRTVYLWQIGEKVRYSNFGFDAFAKPVNGISKPDGDRMLVIDDQSISLQLIR
ncbi:hypothetical protein [Flavobacterium sp. J27]|uniref:hypothetical protein n=1 Tax=Flavobacterium sp. J27 TaxID=2060419 RepID=UPI001030AD2F|nr:hypothetical protein [Flavobacterium sp. J27]